jgi:hypothetical protein
MTANKRMALTEQDAATTTLVHNMSATTADGGSINLETEAEGLFLSRAHVQKRRETSH